MLSLLCLDLMCNELFWHRIISVSSPDLPEHIVSHSILIWAHDFALQSDQFDSFVSSPFCGQFFFLFSPQVRVNYWLLSPDSINMFICKLKPKVHTPCKWNYLAFVWSMNFLTIFTDMHMYATCWNSNWKEPEWGKSQMHILCCPNK